MMNKILIIYYSRTSATKKIAETLAQRLNSDLEEIKSVKNYRGIWGYLIAGREAMLKKSANIELTTRNPRDYDLVIVGTPVWTGNVSSPVRTYLEQNKNNFKNIAFFCTMGGSGDKRAFIEMEKSCNQKPVAILSVLAKEVIEDKSEDKIKEFLDKIK